MTVHVPNANTASGARAAVKIVTFTGAAELGEVGAVPLFTVAGGAVLIEHCSARIITTLTDAANTAALSIGTASDTDALVGAQGADNAAAGNILGAATVSEPTIGLGQGATGAVNTTQLNKVTTEDIIGTVATEAVTGGVLEVVLCWKPMSPGASLVAA